MAKVYINHKTNQKTTDFKTAVKWHKQGVIVLVYIDGHLKTFWHIL